jgi:hypothetical protein
MRFNEGKAELSYILTFPTAMEQLSSVMQYGAKKYARGNYLIGSNATEYVDSLLRHLQQMMKGEMNDQESGCPHSGHLLFNAAMLAEVLSSQPEKNDLLNLAWVEDQVPVTMETLTSRVTSPDVHLDR